MFVISALQPVQHPSSSSSSEPHLLHRIPLFLPSPRPWCDRPRTPGAGEKRQVVIFEPFSPISRPLERVHYILRNGRNQGIRGRRRGGGGKGRGVGPDGVWISQALGLGMKVGGGVTQSYSTCSVGTWIREALGDNEGPLAKGYLDSGGLSGFLTTGERFSRSVGG